MSTVPLGRMRPTWWSEKHARRGPLVTPRRSPQYRANWEATRLVRWGYYRLRPISLDAIRTPNGDDYTGFPDTGGTPLDWLLAWEEIERRERGA